MGRASRSLPSRRSHAMPCPPLCMCRRGDTCATHVGDRGQPWAKDGGGHCHEVLNERFHEGVIGGGVHVSDSQRDRIGGRSEDSGEGVSGRRRRHKREDPPIPSGGDPTTSRVSVTWKTSITFMMPNELVFTLHHRKTTSLTRGTNIYAEQQPYRSKEDKAIIEHFFLNRTIAPFHYSP